MTSNKFRFHKTTALGLSLLCSSAIWADKAYLEITLMVDEADRANAGAVYSKYKQPFLDTIEGAQTKELLVRESDVQVLHGFDSTEAAAAYLQSDLFTNDVAGELGPLLKADPEVRIYSAQ